MTLLFPKKQAILIGEEQLDFLFTLLDPHFMPSELFLICPKSKLDQALFFQEGLVQAKIPSEIWSIDESKAQSIEKIAKQLHDKLVSKLKHKYAEPIVLNASGGGSRLLSFVAPKVFEALKCPVFFCYQNVLTRLGTQPLHLKLNVKLTLTALFKFFGICYKSSLDRDSVDLHLVAVYRTIYQNLPKLKQALQRLTKWSDDAKNQHGYSKALSGSDLTVDYVTDFIKYLEESGLCELKQGKLYFFDEAYRQFCAGGWIGFLIFDTLTQLQLLTKINDLHFNLYFEFSVKPTLTFSTEIASTYLIETKDPLIIPPTLSIPPPPQEISADELLPQETIEEQINPLDFNISTHPQSQIASQITEGFDFKLENDFFDSMIAELQTPLSTRSSSSSQALKSYKIELACVIQLELHFFFAPRLEEVGEYIDLIKALKNRFFFNAYLISYLPYPKEYLYRCQDLNIILIDDQNILKLHDILKKYL